MVVAFYPWYNHRVDNCGGINGVVSQILQKEITYLQNTRTVGHVTIQVMMGALPD